MTPEPRQASEVLRALKTRAEASKGSEEPKAEASQAPKPAKRPRAPKREAKPLPAKRVGLGATQSGEETFSVVDREVLDLAAPVVAPSTPPPPAQEAPAAERPQPTPAAPPPLVQQREPEALPTPEPPRALAAAPPPPIPERESRPTPEPPRPVTTAPADCATLCATLRLQGRFDEAVRVAREGLARGGDSAAVLIELSRAELGLGRINAAIDTARDAHFAGRSRETVTHLIRLLTDTRRIAPEDGATLRRAATRHPNQPLLLHAAGLFESMYGDPAAAEKLLRAALPLEPDDAVRRAITAELARVEETRARAAGPG